MSMSMSTAQLFCLALRGELGMERVQPGLAVVGLRPAVNVGVLLLLLVAPPRDAVPCRDEAESAHVHTAGVGGAGGDSLVCVG